MSGSTINPAFRFIQTAGVSGLVSGVQTGMVAPEQALTAFHAVGSAIDSYKEAVPQNTTLTGLRRSIRGLPVQGNIASAAQDEILGLLATHKDDVELVVRMAIKINTVGQIAITGGAAVANVEAPYDLGAEMKWIPPGEFQMGSRDDDLYADSHEKPLRTVMTGGFFMLDHPVTNAEFRTFLQATGRKSVRDFSEKIAVDDQPAIDVTQKEAAAYSQWLGEEVSKRTGYALIGRLPTEAEWEKAAKGPSGDEFVIPATLAQAHFGAEATRAVNHPDAYANGYGLKDIIGNVWEWTSSPCVEGSSRCILRGASWDYVTPHTLRAAYRTDGYHPIDLGDFFGFRPVLAPQDSEG